MFNRLTPETLDAFRALYYQLAPDYTHSVLLDSCGWVGKTGGLYRMGFEAQQVVQIQDGRLLVNGQPVLIDLSDPAAMAGALQEAVPVHQHPTDASFWAGVIGYEMAHYLESAVLSRDPENTVGPFYFVQYRHGITWEPETGHWEVFSPDPAWKKRVDKALTELEPADVAARYSWRGAPVSPIRASFSPDQFEAAVERLKAHIQAGDLYQANLSIRFVKPDFPSDQLFALYQALVTRNPSPFSGIWWSPEGVLLSNSPERLVKLDIETQRLETRPIAGTRGRGTTQAEEDRIADVLATDPKEQAEHLMMVDMERNDLGRISLPGTVHVPDVGVLERYSHVTHIVSQVEGQWDDSKTWWDVVNAMFPGGTITGCPKIRCMNLLSQLEPVPRGLYTGSLGVLDARGNLDLNILIRSLYYWPQSGELHFHAGAGIVADSVPAWEYRECLRKSAVIQGVLDHDHNPAIA